VQITQSDPNQTAVRVMSTQIIPGAPKRTVKVTKGRVIREAPGHQLCSPLARALPAGDRHGGEGTLDRLLRAGSRSVVMTAGLRRLLGDAALDAAPAPQITQAYLPPSVRMQILPAAAASPLKSGVFVSGGWCSLCATVEHCLLAPPDSHICRRQRLVGGAILHGIAVVARLFCCQLLVSPRHQQQYPPCHTSTAPPPPQRRGATGAPPCCCLVMPPRSAASLAPLWRDLKSWICAWSS